MNAVRCINESCRYISRDVLSVATSNIGQFLLHLRRLGTFVCVFLSHCLPCRTEMNHSLPSLPDAALL